MISSKGLSTIIAVLSAAGIAISLISLQQHYATSKTSFCDFGANFNCDIVNRSIYSEIAGVPVALVGLLGYAALLSLAILCKKRQDSPVTLLVAASVGMVFAFYLTYIERFVLGVWCILCLSSQGLILAITFCSIILVYKSKLQK